MSLTLRNIKGSPLTYTEMDDNLTYLEGLAAADQALASVLTEGNTTGGNNIILSNGDTLGNNNGNLEFADIPYGGVVSTDSPAPGFGAFAFYDISPNSTSGSGTGLLVTIARNIMTNDVFLTDILNAGQDYEVADTITFLGTQIGLTSPAGDVTYTITAIDNGFQGLKINSDTRTIGTINAASGDGQLDLRYGADNEVMLSNDNGDYSDEFLYLSEGYIELSSYRADSVVGIYGDRVIALNGMNTFVNTVSNAINIGGTNTFNDVSNTIALGSFGTTITQSNRVYIKNPVIATEAAPSSTADASGVQGEIRYDDDWVYIKTSAGWKRSGLSTF
jgi:hypothetical protein